MSYSAARRGAQVSLKQRTKNAHVDVVFQLAKNPSSEDDDLGITRVPPCAGGKYLGGEGGGEI